jgi:hypothetical protein
MRIKIFLTIVPLFVLIMCSDRKEIKINSNQILIDSFPIEENILLTEFFEFNTGMPLSIFAMDSILLITDIGERSGHVFYHYNLLNSRLSPGYVSRGSGPNEVLVPVSSGVYDNTVWVHDLGLKKIISTSMNPSHDTLGYREIFLKNTFFWIKLINENKALVVGEANGIHKAQLVDLSLGETVANFGKFENIPEDMPLEVIQDIFKRKLYIKPGGDKFVLLYRFTDTVEIFDMESAENVTIRGPENMEMSYEVIIRNGGRSFIEYTDETREAFKFGTVTDKFIYALFSGGRSNDANSQYGDIIFVYDWEGKPVKKLKLNQKIMSFTVSKDDGILYSYNVDTGYFLKGKIE